MRSTEVGANPQRRSWWGEPPRLVRGAPSRFGPLIGVRCSTATGGGSDGKSTGSDPNAQWRSGLSARCNLSRERRHAPSALRLHAMPSSRSQSRRQTPSLSAESSTLLPRFDIHRSHAHSDQRMIRATPPVIEGGCRRRESAVLSHVRMNIHGRHKSSQADEFRIYRAASGTVPCRSRRVAVCVDGSSSFIGSTCASSAPFAPNCRRVTTRQCASSVCG